MNLTTASAPKALGPRTNLTDVSCMFFADLKKLGWESHAADDIVCSHQKTIAHEASLVDSVMYRWVDIP